MDIQKEQKSHWFILILLCLLSFGLGYFLFRISDTKENRQAPISKSISLRVKPIIGETITTKNSYVGHIIAINEVDIIPYVSGYLKEISVKQGQEVKEGELLTTINSDEYKAKLDVAKAQFLQAQSVLDYNQNYYNRVKKSGAKAFSEIEVDNAKNNFMQAEAQLKSAQANQALAQINYDYCFIKAPISGLVGNFNLTTGDYVTPNGHALLSIIQTNPIRVGFTITDVSYLDMKQNGKKLFDDTVIKLKLANGELFEHNGTFKYTDNKLNKSTNSLSVYADFMNEKNILLPNAFVTVEIYKTFKNAVLISKNYIKMTSKGNFITIARNNKLLQMEIDILAEKDNQYILKNTFKNTDSLILDDIKKIDKNTNIQFVVEK